MPVSSPGVLGRAGFLSHPIRRVVDMPTDLLSPSRIRIPWWTRIPVDTVQLPQHFPHLLACVQRFWNGGVDNSGFIHRVFPREAELCRRKPILSPAKSTRLRPVCPQGASVRVVTPQVSSPLLRRIVVSLAPASLLPTRQDSILTNPLFARFPTG
jgi:hypothetical protein